MSENMSEMSRQGSAVHMTPFNNNSIIPDLKKTPGKLDDIHEDRTRNEQQTDRVPDYGAAGN
jgi:hypothetical protein